MKSERREPRVPRVEPGPELLGLIVQLLLLGTILSALDLL